MSRLSRWTLATVGCVLAAVTLAPPAGAAAPEAVTEQGAGVDALLIGGDPIVVNNWRCAIGFNARNRAGSRYVITSYPCAGSPGMAGLLPAPAGSTSTPYVRGPGGSLLTLSPLQNQAPVGAVVCMSGPTAGYRCGTVTALNQTVNFGGTIVTGLTRTTVCPAQGESGAPFIWNSGGQVIPQGVLVGGSGSCSTGGTTWFKPIWPVLSANGLVLYTG